MTYFLRFFLVPTLIVSLLIFHTTIARAQSPFRLLTVEAASNPDSKVVLGLEELGLNAGPVFIDTNPLLDLGYTSNLAAKFSFPLNSDFKMAVGARYFKFFGSQAISDRVKTTSTLIDKFNIDFQGYTAFVAVTYGMGPINYHANFQYADISGSKVSSPVLALDYSFAAYWSLIAEVGYDLFNKQPRASFGVSKNGPGFGIRFGGTYVEVVDPLKTYKGLIPILDFYWLIGDKQK